MLRNNAHQVVLASIFLLVAHCSGRPSTSYHHQLDNPSDTANLIENVEDRMFVAPSNATGVKVSQWHANMSVNPEELGEYLEGDIMLPNTFKRNGMRLESFRWPGGVVPYMISPFFNEDQQKVIRDAMTDYHLHTCIKFKPYMGEETDYIRITAGNTGCWSTIGRIGGPQNLNLQVPECLTRKGTVIHELMHTIGFLHEQSRFERDDFVDIQWHNIQPGREVNFAKSERDTTEAFGVIYDYGSVMHYSVGAFSRNGQPTIIPRDKRAGQIGQREGFSARDIQKIQRMYKCA
ncbi:PREDICTED: zinc metalloproteinase nas-13-like [Ceratosolen solmsi marchali]|uniref:Metalloendopeptidase n=1 Tax=Ceratosolen solmsi marchali TaxID=326594 RepID=A0AAJ7DVZ3_9HYME|nr:PREDICTED: zinc metalloproteinase nas-13-like [Ceratosolen solmsi marchali]XP_011498435.1 PREDICTED: zinc metalloproteinase nas-13-like [Ceratosolen solmsi marchali]